MKIVHIFFSRFVITNFDAPQLFCQCNELPNLIHNKTHSSLQYADWTRQRTVCKVNITPELFESWCCSNFQVKSQLKNTVYRKTTSKNVEAIWEAALGEAILEEIELSKEVYQYPKFRCPWKKALTDYRKYKCYSSLVAIFKRKAFFANIWKE